MAVDVMCVGAHPDDVEIGMGATVAALCASGVCVALVDLTDGEPTPGGTRERRLLEAERAAEVLGVAERRVLDLPNRVLHDTVEARTVLAEVVRELRPRLLVGPYPSDAHPDHVAAAGIVGAARFYGKFVKTDMRGEPHYARRLLRYFSMHLRAAEPACFAVDVSGWVERKFEALACYESQFGDDRGRRLLDALRVRSAYWGTLAGTAAAEPFESPETPGLRSLTDLL